jgi:hypothetical protein
MPGLMRGVARTAVVAGTASAVSGRVQRRQQGRWAAQDAQAYQQPYPQQGGYAQPYAEQPAYAPPPPPAQSSASDTSAKIDQLRQLGELRDQGILTQAEFEAQKATILGS